MRLIRKLKDHKLIQKLPLVLFLVLFTIGSLEAFIYFYYIYRPANRIFGSAKTYPLEIPAVSQLIKPLQITNNETSLADAYKKYYPEQLTKITSSLESRMVNQSSFVKDSSISYIVGGKIDKIETLGNGSIKFVLKNSTGQTTAEVFSLEEKKDIKAYLMIMSPKSPSRSETTLENAAINDYLIVKISANLLKESPDLIKEVELFRFVD